MNLIFPLYLFVWLDDRSSTCILTYMQHKNSTNLWKNNIPASLPSRIVSVHWMMLVFHFAMSIHFVCTPSSMFYIFRKTLSIIQHLITTNSCIAFTDAATLSTSIVSLTSSHHAHDFKCWRASFVSTYQAQRPCRHFWPQYSFWIRHCAPMYHFPCQYGQSMCMHFHAISAMRSPNW